MPAARITTTSEGRIIFSDVEPAFNDKSICLDIQRTGEHRTVFMLLSADEFKQLRDDIDRFARYDDR
jgi:hypothetical protein